MDPLSFIDERILMMRLLTCPSLINGSSWWDCSPVLHWLTDPQDEAAHLSFIDERILMTRLLTCPSLMSGSSWWGCLICRWVGVGACCSPLSPPGWRTPTHKIVITKRSQNARISSLQIYILLCESNKSVLQGEMLESSLIPHNYKKGNFCYV